MTVNCSFIGVKGDPEILHILLPGIVRRYTLDTPLLNLLYGCVQDFIGMRFGVKFYVDSSGDHTCMRAAQSFALLDESGDIVPLDNSTVGLLAGPVTRLPIFLVAEAHLPRLSASFLAVGRGRRAQALFFRLAHESALGALKRPRYVPHSGKFHWDSLTNSGGGGAIGGGGVGRPVVILPPLWASELVDLAEPVPSVESLTFVEMATESYADAASLELMAADMESAKVLDINNILHAAEPPFVRANMFNREQEERLRRPWTAAYLTETYEEVYKEGLLSVHAEMEKIQREGGKLPINTVRHRILEAFRNGISHIRRARLTFDIALASTFTSVDDACVAYPFFCPAEFETMRAMLMMAVQAARVFFGIE